MKTIKNKTEYRIKEIRKIKNSIYFMILAVIFYFLQTLTIFANELTVSGNIHENNDRRYSVKVWGVCDGNIYSDKVNVDFTAYSNTREMLVYLKVRFKSINGNPEIIEDVHKNVHNSKYNTIRQYSEDGIYELTFYVEDGGEIQSEEIITFAIDTKAPVINIDGVSHGSMYNSKVELSVNVIEQFFEGNIVNVEILNENERGKITNTNPEYICKASNNTNIYSLFDEGKYTVKVSAIDGRGNKSSRVISFIIDLNAPDIEVFNFNEKINKSEILNKAPTFSIVVSDWMFSGGTADITLFRKLKNEAFEKVESQKYILTSEVSKFTLPVNREGIYVLNVCAKDALSNETTNNYYFTLDESPPVIAYFSDFNEKYLKEFKLPDKITCYIKDLTDVSYHTYLNEKETRGGIIRKDGKYILQIVAKDEAGNATEEDIAFIIDNTKPTVIVSGLNTEGEVDKNSNIKLTLFDADDYFEMVTVNGEEIALSDTDKEANIPINNYGEYEITVKASDNANNTIERTIVTNCKALSKAPNITELSGNIKKLTKSSPENSVNNFSKKITKNISTTICIITTFIIIALVIFAVFTFVDTNKKEC